MCRGFKEKYLHDGDKKRDETPGEKGENSDKNREEKQVNPKISCREVKMRKQNKKQGKEYRQNQNIHGDKLGNIWIMRK